MDDHPPPTGKADVIADGVRRIIAPNPSPMTFWGTNTYLLGHGDLVVVDPGPKSQPHLQSIIDAIGGANVTHIFVTHSHLDHSPLAQDLSQHVNAPIVAFGDSQSGQSQIMQQLAQSGLTGGGEGVDQHFTPDLTIADQDSIKTGAGRITALHTPGHMGNHIALVWRDCVFTGDSVMGWASTMISPPDGDLRAFLASCQKLMAFDQSRFYPGHGAPIDDPAARLKWLITHRNNRTDQIIAQLKAGDQTVAELTRSIYNDVPKTLLLAAERNVFAHLIALVQDERVIASPRLCVDAKFELSQA